MTIEKILEEFSTFLGVEDENDVDMWIGEVEYENIKAFLKKALVTIQEETRKENKNIMNGVD